MEEKGLIFDIQRFSLHDGPGIRTTVFLKGCPLRCQWCANPESLRKTIEIGYSPKDCIVCHRCVSACEKKAIIPKQDGIEIDRTKCVNNLTCVEACPTGAMTVFGSWYTVKDVLDIVLKDAAFYKNSGGGMTLSGGEVLAQSVFASKLLKEAQEKDVHTAIETTGYAPFDAVERVIRYTDLVLYDLKLVDRDQHRRYTGVDNTLILDNLKKILKQGKKLIARIPLIPGVNMDTLSIKKFIQLITENNIEEVNLLPFHQLGESKYQMLGMDYTFGGVKAPDDSAVQAMADEMIRHGINVKIGG